MRISRPATRDDIDEVVRLASVMFATMGHDVAGESWLRAARDAMESRLGETLAVFVSDHPAEDGRLVASAAVSIVQRLPTPRNPSGRVGHVQWVATDEAFRRQGRGRAVMADVLAWCRESGLAVVELNATADGEPLYRSLGFGDPANPHLIAVIT